MYDEQLAARVRALVGPHPAVTERKMFGGLAFMLAGNMACGIIGSELMVRTGPASYEQTLARRGARPMDFTGRTMKGFAVIGEEGLTGDALAAFVQLGLDFAATLPAKGG